MNRFASLLAALLVTDTLSGCVDDAMKQVTAQIDSLMGKKPAEEKPAHEPEEGEEEEGEEKPPAPPPENTLIPKEMQSLPFKEVAITMPDGVVVTGRLYDPSQKPEAAEDEESEEEEAEEETTEEEEEATEAPAAPVTKYPLVVLTHGLSGSYKEWGALPADLVKQGYAVFAMDLRGHGKSTRNSKGQAVSWRTFEAEQWKEIPNDIDRALKFLEKSGKYPQVNTKAVAYIGGKLGANAALIDASKHASRVKALVLLSPGKNYKGLETARPMIEYPNAVYFMASDIDDETLKETETLYKWALGPKSMQLFKLPGEGAEMIKYRPKLREDIPTWLTKYLPPVAPPSAERFSLQAPRPEHNVI